MGNDGHVDRVVVDGEPGGTEPRPSGGEVLVGQRYVEVSGGKLNFLKAGSATVSAVTTVQNSTVRKISSVEIAVVAASE